ncbi:hypothetical protein NEPAR04_1175 [Nematocida parisii]|nr:hypothetical protein NEPAR08_1099 [Nematocida parisii]KAI5128369.1 hypothetical protein NEPAR03_1278 [Nematocida parisii]KAI5141703.1 hypothetical protein NEPAR04_1175 [Nematocida parisii]
MTYNIDADELRKEVENKFSKQRIMEKDKDINTLYDIVTEVNKKKRIFIDSPEPLERLAYNILYMKIYNRIISNDIEYNEDTITDKIIESIKQTDIVIDIIKEAADELHSEDKKAAFYRLMGNNHAIMANTYILRKKFFDSSIKILCKSMNIQELDDKMTSEDAMIKLCKLTQSKKYSRLQRALDILVKHGDNLTIVDEDDNETKQSNASSLGLSKDDIKSLQLLTRIDKWSAKEFSIFLNDSIYDSIRDNIKQDNARYLFHTIRGLYYGVYYDTSIYYDEIDTETKEDSINCLKRHLNNLLNINERVCNIQNRFFKPRIFVDITRNGLTANKFKNNVVKKYLTSIELNISIINGTTALSINETVVPVTTHKFKRVLIILIIIFIIIFIIIMSIFGIFPTETKEIMNNLNNLLF